MAKVQEGKLPKAFKNKWLKALRSGDFQQANGYLYDKYTDSYCCLGVAAKLCGVSHFGGSCFIIPKSGLRGIDKVPSLLVGDSGIPDDLARMNDKGHDFEEIADYIETNL
jgi:hypothetical protein